MAAKTAKKAARTAKAVPATKPEQEPEVIRVKATLRGFYDNLIRNPGDVFLMDVAVFEKAPTADETKDLKKEDRDLLAAKLDAHESVTVNGTEYLLPTWVELVDEDEDVTEPKGHAKEKE